MFMPGSIKPQIVFGSIDSIDLLARELSIAAEGEHLTVYVPLSCLICLNGDSVRMRLMQPGDVVEIEARTTNSGWAADRIDIRRPFVASWKASSMSIGPK